MNLARIDEYAGDSEFDRAFLTEVAKRMDAIWGHVRNAAAARVAVGILYLDTLVFRDGFKVNHGWEVNSFVGVDGAAAVMAAVWDWMELDWLAMKKRFRPGPGEPQPPRSLHDELRDMAIRHPSVVLVDDQPARWPHWPAPVPPPPVESRTAMRRRRRRLKVPGGIWRLFVQTDSGPVHLENQGALKELVVENWLHVEQVGDGAWWMRVGDMRIRVQAPRNGSPEVDVERGFYDLVQGETKVVESMSSPEVAAEVDGGTGEGRGEE
ncbi:hypothetical protein COCOR_05469 [Corallococcus coralloides DSM 2259]|uniref:Uncharacterized protein n=1 Tax=Corallococcus coralloides (strain ATCC 25202 / DSM 2259 / NBRC 100086 / M2) TaxID=1144275 RepID=H8MZ33_CORCM|nr:hypothetical protein [Corallococcus coralloides]AFE06388.1 hypothetical protein COCOR_05469 [Corallococcus coralloides DSM 2259]